MKPETELYHLIEKEIKWHCNFIQLPYHITRIESGYTSQGIPDINCCIAGKEFWIECKFNSELEPLQISWAKQRRKAGGNVFTIIQQKDNFLLYDPEQFLYESGLNYLILHLFKVLELPIEIKIYKGTKK